MEFHKVLMLGVLILIVSDFDGCFPFVYIYSVSFTISAIVEILSCVALHPVLNRVGRKLPYFIAALCFAIVALVTILTQYLTLKNSQSKSQYSI